MHDPIKIDVKSEFAIDPMAINLDRQISAGGEVASHKVNRRRPVKTRHYPTTCEHDPQLGSDIPLQFSDLRLMESTTINVTE